MSNSTCDDASGTSLSILKFWHNIEFFIPYDLQGQILEDKLAPLTVRRFSRDQLAVADCRSLWSVQPPRGKELTGFDLFLNIFDKRELAEVTQRVLKQALAPGDAFTQDERTDLEGLTCCAQLQADKHGELVLEKVAVSSAPWAMGRIARHHLTGLDFAAFQASLDAFKDTLLTFGAQRLARHARQADEDATIPQAQQLPLDADELLTLSAMVAAWASYQAESALSDSPLLVIRAKFADVKKKSAAAPEEDDDASTPEAEITIMNSFYAQDIARVIDGMRQGISMPVLEAYLTPLPETAQLDLYQPAGREHIAATLAPAQLPRGHWLDNSGHAMSLMQQFAINTVFRKLEHGGIFSVNGPPGTGKTTLLRDIFANNIVLRARALAAFPTAAAAFKPERVKVNFRGAKVCTISQLRDELGGFEMVVASSNNAAVDNISRDLPKTKSLGEPAWRLPKGAATIDYLQTVANNIAARNSKGNYDALEPDDVPWGLISCALGKSANRNAFKDGISHAGSWDPENKPAKGYDPRKHQSLWDWRAQPAAISYDQARKNFLLIDDEVSTLIARLDQLAALQLSLRGQTQASFTEHHATTLQEAQRVFDHAAAITVEAADERQLCMSQLALLAADEERIARAKPGWWARLRQSAAALAYSRDLAANLEQQGSWSQRRRAVEAVLLTARKAEQHAADALLAAQQELATSTSRWLLLQQELEHLARQFPLAATPDSVDMLEEDSWQVDGLWRDDVLNARRSALFAAALHLQQAWLAESLQQRGGIGGNVVAICHLLGGKRLDEMEHALTLWRSLFMIVPVVSTTLASFANQFRYLGAGTIGWLFIDEAGQAVPQAAVGALWRARRAVVVGDPKQIEPVFTVPIKLIEALAHHAQLPVARALAPHQSSVQVLADAANSVGTAVDFNGKPQWVGCPLRVHRRCVDPMFSIANKVAYHDKMVFYAWNDRSRRIPPGTSLDLGESAWVNVGGAATSKQSVPGQVALVLHALVALYGRTGTLPALYIISPFKRIKYDLIERLERVEHWSEVAPAGAALPAQAELKEWCKARIGTVHTFQGKEENMIWMVLGCDQPTEAAAKWAADKPNILNVALTRAKHRFFMIGDAALWGKQQYFSVACKALPLISGQMFLQRIGRLPALVIA